MRKDVILKHISSCISTETIILILSVSLTEDTTKSASYPNILLEIDEEEKHGS